VRDISVSEFIHQTELAKESFDALNIPYIDPFKLREMKKKEDVKLDSLKLKNREAFSTFCEVMRNKQPFLKKATDDELEGMFLRMTPAERLKYIKDDTKPEGRKRPSDESRVSSSVASEKQPKKDKKQKKEKKVKRDYSFDNFIDDRVVEDDYDDYSSDDVSLVSESENELVDEITPRSQEKDEKKKKKKNKKKSREEESSVVDTPSKIKHFKWS
jgi:hypothetical protein